MSVESRSARDILNEIRGVINHLKQKDILLTDELNLLRSIGKDTGNEQLQNATEEITRLLAENTKLKQDYVECQKLWNQQKSDNTVMRNNIKTFNDDIAEKYKAIHTLQREVAFYKNNATNLDGLYQKLQQDFDTLSKDLEHTKSDLQSYINAEGLLKTEIQHLKHKNSELEKTITSLEIAAKSTDQNQLQQQCADNILELNKLKEQLKNIKKVSKENYDIGNQWKDIAEKRENEIVLLNTEIAKLRSREGAAAGSAVQAPIHQVAQPLPTVATLPVDTPTNDDEDAIVGEADDASLNNPSVPSQPSGGSGGLLAGVAKGISNMRGSVWNAIGLGGGGVETKSDNENTKTEHTKDDRVADGKTPVIPPSAYTVTTDVTGASEDNQGPAAASSNNTVQPAAAGAQEDYSDILNIDILDDKAKLIGFFSNEGLNMPDRKQHVAMKYVQMILNNPKYQSRLSKTAKYYDIDTTISDEKKIEQIWKFFSEYERLKNATKTDYEQVCQEMKIKTSKSEMIQNFNRVNRKIRAEFSFKLFSKLKNDSGNPSLKKLYEQAGFSVSRNRDIMIHALIEDTV